MQDIREYRHAELQLVQEARTITVGLDNNRLRNAFAAQRKAAEKRLESGETVALKITETHRIGRNDPCPCGSNAKFKKCCGSRLADGGDRIKD